MCIFNKEMLVNSAMSNFIDNFIDKLYVVTTSTHTVGS